MATNANVFNSRVTSEALEAKFRQVFPAQAGAELIQDLYASGVIQPVIDFSSVAEGSVLAVNLQTAWDFSTGHSSITNTTTNLVTTPGFWKVEAVITMSAGLNVGIHGRINLSDGISSKIIWEFEDDSTAANGPNQGFFNGVVFLRSGDTLSGVSNNSEATLSVSYRQIADVNGNLVNPLGFTFQ